MDFKDKAKIFQNLALVSQIGISMILPIIGGVFFGNLLDNKLGTGSIFLIIFLLIGVGTSFLTLFKITSRSMRK